MATVQSIRPAPADPFPHVVSVRFDRVYGRVSCYPVNHNAKVIARLARTKTLSPQNLQDARELGFELHVDQASVEMLEQFVGGVVS